MPRASVVALAALLLVPLALAAPTRVAEIRDFTYAPDPILVNAGDIARWTNKDAFAHTVTCDTGSCAFASTSLYLLDSFSTTLVGGGTQRYHCNIHFGMTGKLFVGTSSSLSPELAPDASTLAASRPLLAGAIPDPTKVFLTIRIANPGAAASTASRVDAIVIDAQGQANTVGSSVVPPISGGGSRLITIEWPMAPLVGDSRVAIHVDPNNAVTEGDEVNNLVGGDVHVGLLAEV